MREWIPGMCLNSSIRAPTFGPAPEPGASTSLLASTLTPLYPWETHAATNRKICVSQFWSFEPNARDPKLKAPPLQICMPRPPIISHTTPQPSPPTVGGAGEGALGVGQRQRLAAVQGLQHRHQGVHPRRQAVDPLPRSIPNWEKPRWGERGKPQNTRKKQLGWLKGNHNISFPLLLAIFWNPVVWWTRAGFPFALHFQSKPPIG